MERNGWTSQIGDERARSIVVGDDDRNLPVIDKAEFFSDGGVGKIKRERLVSPVDTEMTEDVLGVPAGFLLVIIEVEIMANGFAAEEVGVEIEKLMGDLGGLAKIGFGALVLGPKHIGLPRRGQLAIAIAAPRSLSDGVEAREGAVNDGKIHIDPSLDELGGNNADGKTIAEAGADLR